MRIKDGARFPHPVLSSETLDYGSLSLSLSMELEETPELAGLTVTGSIDVEDAEVLRSVHRGEVVVGLMVTCRDTYYDAFHQFGVGAFKLDISAGELRGLIQIRCVAVAISDDLLLRSAHISNEFPASSRLAMAGDIVGCTEETQYEVGMEKLAPLESIFHLILQPDVPPGEFRVGLDGESIDILASSELHNFISLVRDQSTREVLTSSLYLPTVMCVLDAMKGDCHFEGKRWHAVMSAKCNSAGIDINDCEVISAAQMLLDRPLFALRKVLEGVNR